MDVNGLYLKTTEQMKGNDAFVVSIAQVKLFPPGLLFSVAMENSYSTSAEQL